MGLGKSLRSLDTTVGSLTDFNIPQSTPAVLIYKVFGQFCDDATSIEPDELSHQFVLNLIEPMSASYKDTTGSTARKAVSRSLGSSHTGTSGGHELTRASIFRHHLLAYLKVALPSIGIDTLEPTQVDKVSIFDVNKMRHGFLLAALRNIFSLSCMAVDRNQRWQPQSL